MILVHDRWGYEVSLREVAARSGRPYSTVYGRYRRYGDNYERLVSTSSPAPYRASTFTDLTSEEHRAMHKRWRAMIHRCYDPRDPGYHNYGGRGIQVYEAWRGGPLGFKAFFNYVGRPPFPGAELDRIDNDGNYEPGNVRWATHELNDNNRRTNTFCWIDTPKGREKMTLAQAARYAGLPQTVVKTRYSRGDRGNDLIRPSSGAKRKTKRRTTRDPIIQDIADQYGEDYRSLYMAFARLGYDYDLLIQREERRRGQCTTTDTQEA